MCSTHLGLALAAFSLSISGCQLLVAEPPTHSTARINQSAPDPAPVENPVAFLPTSNPAPDNFITVQRYKIDAQCQCLVPTDLEVAKESSLDNTIETIVGDRSNGDFRIADYRLDINEANNIATIDFRLPIDSPRSIYSLSNCEQFALLGELRKTLTANSDWGIETVNFQVQGEDIQY